MTADKTAVPEWIDVAFADGFGWSTYAAHEGDKTRFIRSDLCASGQVQAVEMLGELLAYEEWQAHVGGVVPDRFIGVINRALEAYRAALTPAPQPEGQDHRAFPDAADGRPMPPMGDDLMTAGLSGDDARFVALQLARNGLKGGA